MIVTVWNNGSYNKLGAGYGFKLNTLDRDKFFNRKWESIVLELENYPEPINVNINKSSFCGPKCKELINKEIEIWLLDNGLAPWPKSNPPKIKMNHISENRFIVRLNKE